MGKKFLTKRDYFSILKEINYTGSVSEQTINKIFHKHPLFSSLDEDQKKEVAVKFSIDLTNRFRDYTNFNPYNVCANFLMADRGPEFYFSLLEKEEKIKKDLASADYLSSLKLKNEFGYIQNLKKAFKELSEKLLEEEQALEKISKSTKLSFILFLNSSKKLLTPVSLLLNLGGILWLYLDPTQLVNDPLFGFGVTAYILVNLMAIGTFVLSSKNEVILEENRKSLETIFKLNIESSKKKSN
ncbi:MAG: hypothetical protein N3D10_01195 [Candidatus Micrarchaeota archaeon]|nr:hypothetical protein [Candidatus Micrarchaeota archaeon]